MSHRLTRLTAELTPEKRIALAYSSGAARAATLAVLALDTRLASILRRRGEALLAQVRLAWWRDMLAGPVADWPRGDEVLDLLREWQDPAGLAELVDGWEALLCEDLDAPAIDTFALGRGRAFGLLAGELGGEQEPAETCGRYWALADLAANLGDAAEKAAVLAQAGNLKQPGRLPRMLRPLAVLGGLARRSIARGGTPLLDGPAAGLMAMRLGIIGR